MEDQSKNDQLNHELNIVFRYLIKIGIPKIEAEDAVQETAYKYLKFHDSIRSVKARSWLIRVALNYYYDQCRKNNKYLLNFEEEQIDHYDEDFPELQLLGKERKEELYLLLSRLKPHFSELLLLKYIYELSYNEISHLLGIRESTIKTNLFRARQKMKKVYEEAENERL